MSRVLVTGAHGLIGSAVVGRLLRSGHDVVLGVRDPDRVRVSSSRSDVVRIDFSSTPSDAQWMSRLANVEVIVNAVGIFAEQAHQTFDQVHVNGPMAMYAAASRSGVRLVVHVSALGAAVDAATGFLSSKGRVEALLAALPIRSVRVRPSLVFAPDGVSTRWFARLAALPLTPLPGDGRQMIQPVHLDDLAEAIERVVEAPDDATGSVSIDAVGPVQLTLRDYLRTLKEQLGFAGPFLPVPGIVVRAGTQLLGRIAAGPVSDDSIAMLEAGNTADPAAFASVLGRLPQPAGSFVASSQRVPMRRDALLWWLLPLARWSVASMWIVTGIVSAFVFPVADSLALLARAGITGGLATASLYGAAALDIGLGLGMLVMRDRRWIYRAQIVLMLFYTAVITIWLPEFWWHPYGPVLKNVPILAMVLLLHELDRTDGRHCR